MFWPFYVWINCSSDQNFFENSRPSASNFKRSSRSLEQFFLKVGQNNFGNKIPVIIYRVNVFWRFCEAVLRSLGDLEYKKDNSGEKFMQLPLKINKKYLLWHQAWPHNDLLLLKTKVQRAHQYLFMASNTLDHVAQKGHGQRNS